MAIVFTVVAIYFIISSSIDDKPLSGRGSQIDRAGAVDIGGAFTLTDQDGKVFASSTLEGKPSIIYFGFSYCPDICPTSLHKITEVVNTLDKYGITVTPVFITLDPKRDTAEVLKKYLAHFHKRLVGLTGRPEDIKTTADKFKVYYALAQGDQKAQDDYMLDHTSLVYIMDKNGHYASHFHLDSKPEEIIEYIRLNMR